MLSGAGTGFFQSAIGANQLQQPVIVDHALSAARAEHPGLQADARLNRAGCGVIVILGVFSGGG